ncbi:MAG: dephospho-CoA kinase [Sediminibacterium sp.]|nr:dephospho-CoA kinase [Sediminibacterium sp.]
MLKVGITGNMGAGKSTVVTILQKLGVPVYDSDDASKKLMNTNLFLINQIKQYFGADIYTENGILNRSKLAEIVFANPQKLALLNGLVHPLTIADFRNWAKNQRATYCVKESSLLFETDAIKEVDLAVGVFAPENISLQRIKARTNMDITSIKKRLQYQINPSIKMKLCDYIIHNNGDELLLPKVLLLHKQLSDFDFQYFMQ